MLMFILTTNISRCGVGLVGENLKRAKANVEINHDKIVSVGIETVQNYLTQY
jgi:hypothetical protein